MSRTSICLMIILISGVILRVAGMNDPVSYDEAYTYVGFASRSLWAIISDYSLPNNHIFHSLLVHFSVMIWGNHPWSLRLPALLAGLLTILAAYGFGKAAYSEESGLTAAAIVAYFPELVRFSTEARGYSLVGLFTLLIFWL
ncbi:MAG TPA: glycosyltransferase family 39 protein, partial [Phototrophicaceae bacterium]|nr:glycosyltransferase family 39 protein [Phototrophicaceae bacterium]